MATRQITAAELAEAREAGAEDTRDGCPESSPTRLVRRITGRDWMALDDDALTAVWDAYEAGQAGAL